MKEKINMKSFSSYHPVILFTFYIFMIFITMFSSHPVIIGISLIMSLLFYALVGDREHLLSDYLFYLVFFLLIVVINMLFQHYGATPLFFLNDKPITLEALYSGISTASMLIAILFWSKSYSVILTSDKFLFLFSNSIPRIALLISMSMRYIPSIKRDIRVIKRAQMSMGLLSGDSYTDRIMSFVRIVKSVISKSLENAVERSDSMRARGYSSKKRSTYYKYTFFKRDKVMIVFIMCLAISFFVFYFISPTDFSYYPEVQMFDVGLVPVMQFLLFFISAIIPIFIELKEELYWKYLKSKI